MLRLLHTSDWHLGQLLRDRERTFEHEQFLTWLRSVIVRRSVDVLLMSGDVFDVANPPASAQRLFFDFVARARAERPSLQIVVVAGNHDSPSRLEAPNPLVAALGMTVIGRVPWQSDTEGPNLDALIVPLSGPTGVVEALCLTVPFLRPGDLPRQEGEGDAYTRGIEELYRQLTERALALRQPGQALIAMGHATVRGASLDQLTETEEEHENDAIRPILYGGLDRLRDRIFSDRLSYVALGHLHRAGKVGGREHVRYSGSPLPLSFAERCYRHQIVYVELEAERVTELEPIEVPRVVEMLRLPAQPAPLEKVLAALHDWAPSPEEERCPIWLEVALEPSGYKIFDLVAQIDDALRGKPVYAWRLAEVKSSRGSPQASAPSSVSSLDEVKRSLDPEQLLREAWRRAGSDVPLGADLVDCLRELLATEGSE
jgi:DNA repair protein SbcD/Mre11